MGYINCNITGCLPKIFADVHATIYTQFLPQHNTTTTTAGSTASKRLVNKITSGENLFYTALLNFIISPLHASRKYIYSLSHYEMVLKMPARTGPT